MNICKKILTVLLFAGFTFSAGLQAGTQGAKKRRRAIEKRERDARKKAMELKEALRIKLFEAAAAGNSAEVSSILEDDGDVNSSDDKGITALMYAAISDNSDCVRLLIKAGAHVNARNSDGKTAICGAAAHDNYDVMDVLRDAGAVVTYQDIKDFCEEVNCIRNMKRNGVVFRDSPNESPDAFYARSQVAISKLKEVWTPPTKSSSASDYGYGFAAGASSAGAR